MLYLSPNVAALSKRHLSFFKSVYKDMDLNPVIYKEQCLYYQQLTLHIIIRIQLLN